FVLLGTLKVELDLSAELAVNCFLGNHFEQAPPFRMGVCTTFLNFHFSPFLTIYQDFCAFPRRSAYLWSSLPHRAGSSFISQHFSIILLLCRATSISSLVNRGLHSPGSVAVWARLDDELRIGDLPHSP